MENNENLNVKQEGSTGPIIGTIIILAVIVLGGLYFWAQSRNNAEESAATESLVEEIQAVSSSDEAADIENDLNNTDIEGLDSELNGS